MPQPREDEGEEEFVDRCIPKVMDKEGLSQSEAIATCYGIYNDWD